MERRKIRWDLIFLSLILLLGLFLRFYRIDVLSRFIWDEGRDMLAIRNIIVNRDITLFGPFNELDGQKDFFGVFHYYLMLPALWIFNFDPVGPAMFTALLGVAGIGLTYVWLRKRVDFQEALMVCGLLAVSPMVVDHQRWAWNPHTLGFFGILYLLFLDKVNKKSNKWWVFLSGLMLGLSFQLHYFSIVLIAVAGAVFRKKNINDLFIWLWFGIGFLLPNLSFLLFDLTHEWFYLKIIKEMMFRGDGKGLVGISLNSVLMDPIIYMHEVFSGLLGSMILGGVFMLGWWVYVISILRNYFKKNEGDVAEVGLVLAWVLMLVIVMIFPRLADDYHSAPIWISLGLSILFMLKKILGNMQWIAYGVLMIIMILANDIDRKPSWQENMPLVRSVAKSIATNVGDGDEALINVASFVDADTKATRFRYFLVNDGAEMMGVDEYPQAHVLYAISPHSIEETMENPAWELETFREGEFEEIWSDEGWSVYKLLKMTDESIN